MGPIETALARAQAKSAPPRAVKLRGPREHMPRWAGQVAPRPADFGNVTEYAWAVWDITFRDVEALVFEHRAVLAESMFAKMTTQEAARRVMRAAGAEEEGT